jgi:hypothetical protein
MNLGFLFLIYIQYIGLRTGFCQMDVVEGEWVRWGWGLTCEFADVFGGVGAKKIGRSKNCGHLLPLKFRQKEHATTGLGSAQ